MSDLEKLWDDLPSGRPPVDEILREGRRAGAVRRRRLVTRPLVTAGVVTGLAAAFVAGTTVGPLGSGSGSSSDLAGGSALGSAPSLAAFQADLKPAASCDALLSVYQNRGLGMVTAYGWTQPMRFAYDAPISMKQASEYGAGAAPELSTSRGATSDTGTNIQEAGVDEPDTVKTDGSLLVRVQDDELEVYDVSGSKVVRDGTLMFSDIEKPQLLLSGTTVVVIGEDSTAPLGSRDRTGRVETVSLADPADPVVTNDVAYDSSVLSARQHGTTIRLVLSAGLPELSFVQPGPKRTRKEALAANRQVVKDSTITDWLPTYDTGSGPQQLLDCTNVAVPPAKLGLDTVSIVGFDASSPTTLSAIGLAGATTIAYESADDLYLAGSPSPSWGGCAVVCAMPWMPSGDTTYLFDFALDGVDATHVASGEVAGTIADRWSMDSVDGVLRVAVEPSDRTGNFNSIVTFKRDGTDLVEDGRLDHLGPGEQLKAVRWFDDLAIVVTYRQIDPLFVVDLSDDAHPKLVGDLKVRGYSDYLHPLGRYRMLGIGQAGGHTWRAQVGLFGVGHLPTVHHLDTWRYAPGSTAVASTDPRAFTWLPDRWTALIVVQSGGGRRVGYLSIQQLHDGKLHESHIPVGYGTDVAGVRTMELPDQRVVLVTADGVRFLTDAEIGPLRTVEG